MTQEQARPATESAEHAQKAPSDTPTHERAREALVEAMAAEMADIADYDTGFDDYARAVLPLVAAVVEAAVTATRAELGAARLEIDRLRGPFRCCEHCDDDIIHDVEPNQHDLPCTICEDHLSRRAEAAEAERDALREEMYRLAEVLAERNTTIARVEALIEATTAAGPPDGGTNVAGLLNDLRAALSDPNTPEQPPTGYESVEERERVSRELRDARPGPFAGTSGPESDGRASLTVVDPTTPDPTGGE